ncbi:hypothetical protein ACIP29_31550 [Streptomyces coelicoflavus]
MSLDDLFFTAQRELAAGHGVDWPALLRAVLFARYWAAGGI